MIRARILGLLVGVATLGALPAAALGDETADSLDRALTTARLDTYVPAATASVHRCGRVLWNGASGVRRLGSSERVTPDTRFVIASATKPMTSAMILQLVDAGRLSLDARVSEFEPGLPNARRITIRQLLSHTSGMSEYSPDDELEELSERRPRHDYTRPEVLRTVGRPYSAPGTKYEYVNANYVTLGGVLEQVTGAGVEDVFRARVATPAGMSAASTFTYKLRAGSEYAVSYEEGEDGRRRSTWVPGTGITTDQWGPVWTDGGFVSTAPDLARFTDALFDGRLISQARLAEMTTLGKGGYGLGVYKQTQGGRRWTGHDGFSGSGYEAEAWHDRSRDVTVTVLASGSEPESADDTNSARIWRAVVSAYDRSPAARNPVC